MKTYIIDIEIMMVHILMKEEIMSRTKRDEDEREYWIKSIQE